MRNPFIAGNWKMYKTVADAVKYIKEFRAMVKDVADVEIVVAPTFTAIHAAAESARNSNVGIAAQDLPQFPGVNSYLGFVVAGTLIQGALLAGLTSGAAMAGDVEFGFFDRLLTAPVRRTSLVLGRQAGTLVLSVLQSTFFLTVAFVFGARYPGGILAST